MLNVGKNIDFECVLKKHDLVWRRCPQSWYDAAFLGNGLMGATIFSSGDNQLCWKMGRTDVIERRDNVIPMYGRRRLPIGDLILHTAGSILSANFRQNLYDAEVTGTIITNKGSIRLKSMIHSDDMCLFVEWKTAGEENNAYFQFHAQRPICPLDIRVYFENVADFDKNEADAHPEPETEVSNDLHITRQRLFAGGGYTTVWSERRVTPDTRQLFLSIGTSDDDNRGKEDAIASIYAAMSEHNENWVLRHRKSWHDFFQKSYISIPNKRLESLYWIQLYKLNCATRSDRPAIDLLGPWYLDSPWQIIWWNLNVELTYWPVYASNHLELGESLCRLLDDNAENLSLNVPEEYRSDSAAIGRTTSYDCINDDLVGIELCDLPFACHNYWLQCCYSMDMKRVKEKFYPLLKRAMALYLHLLEKDKEGTYHLPEALSPEYPDRACDTNADIAFLRWGCSLLLDLSKQFDIDDPMCTQWEDTLHHLVDYQIDDNGLMIGKDVPFSQTHRHYSHLFAIYPLYLLNWDQEDHRDLIVKSLNRWLSFDEKLQGYSYTGAASIYASIRQGNEAESYLEKLMDVKIYPNTFYAEKGPCIETPLSAAKSVQDMLLQSWGNVIRIFPAIPDKWQDVSFYQLRTEGAFLVSAVRQEGCVKYVYVKSLVGGQCAIEPGLGSSIEKDGAGFKILEQQADSVVVEFEKDGEILLWSGSDRPDIIIPEVSVCNQKDNYYGSDAIMPVRKK